MLKNGEEVGEIKTNYTNVYRRIEIKENHYGVEDATEEEKIEALLKLFYIKNNKDGYN